MNPPSPAEGQLRIPPALPADDADFRRLFDLSLDLLAVASLDGYFIRVNPAWTRTLGWSEAELLRRPVEDFMHPDDRERTLAARGDLAKGNVLRGLENRYLCKDGSYRWLSWQCSVELGQRKVYAVARDITERLELERERLIISKLESIGVLAGGIAHDFNNLLGALLLNLDMLSVSGSLDARQEDNLRRARESVYAAEALSKQLISLAEGGAAIRRPIELRPVIEQSVAAALNGAPVRVEFNFDPALWPVDGDETQLRQLFGNLVSNAREAMAPGGTLRVTAVNVPPIAGAPAPDQVRVIIVDTGSGIAPDIMTNIFDPYFSTKPRGVQKGMGLGLTVSRAIVQKHGGTIAVDSPPGEGTTVTLQLPAAKPSAPPATSSPAAVRGAAWGTKILVMDDEPLFREMLAQALRRLGHEVEVAQHGDEAIALFDRAANAGAPFSAVLLDLTVREGKGGAATMEVLRARDPGVRAMVMTGYTSNDILRDYAQHGFCAALTKPFSAEALHATLARVVRSPQ